MIWIFLASLSDNTWCCFYSFKFFFSFFTFSILFWINYFLSILYMCIIPIEHSFSLFIPSYTQNKKKARWVYRALKFFQWKKKLSLRAVHSIKFMILNLICKLRIDRRGEEECWLNEKLINAIIVMWHKLFLPNPTSSNNTEFVFRQSFIKNK